jgi:ATP-dependent Lon protease
MGAEINRGRYCLSTISDFEPYITNIYMRKLLENNLAKPIFPLPELPFDFIPLKRSTCTDNFTVELSSFLPDPRSGLPASSIFQNLSEQKPAEQKSETLKDRINKSSLPEDYKKIALEKELSISNNLASSASKEKEWVETLLKIPFGKYCNLKVSKKENSVQEIRDFFSDAVKDMESVSYGMDNVKEEILDCISQMISTNSDCMPRVLCLQGSQGCGKTSFIRNGISKILNRPFKQINMGGMTDSSFLLGHEQTYIGSRAGMIVNSLIETKVMNPIIFMDEVDKISTSEKGIDVQSVLIHLTDPVQNSDFQDKYFPGINIDLSKVLFVFSCNDDTKLSPILKDRLNIIRVKNPSLNDKVIIGKKYLLKELCPNVGINIDKILLEDDTVKFIITKYCKDDVGLRGLKKCIETILLKINSALYNPMIKYKTLKNISLEEPFEITVSVVEDVLKKNEDKYSELMNSMFL